MGERKKNTPGRAQPAPRGHMVTPAEAMAALGVTESTLRRWEKAKKHHAVVNERGEGLGVGGDWSPSLEECVSTPLARAASSWHLRDFDDDGRRSALS